MTTLTHDVRIDRIPGEFGPILRCSGKLTGATAAALRQELDVLVETGHPAVTLNLTGCPELDRDGIAPVLEAYQQLRSERRRLILVTDAEVGARLYTLGIGWQIQVYPTEESAARALRGGSPAAPAHETWAAARHETATGLRVLYDSLDTLTTDEAMRELTAMLPLCERAEAAAQTEGAGVRCECCPLYYWLGGGTEEIGCRSVVDPILAALQSGDRETAGHLIMELIFQALEMPLAEGGRPPARDIPFPPA
jgi:anti-anti-sigma regulatory factor